MRASGLDVKFLRSIDDYVHRIIVLVPFLTDGIYFLQVHCCLQLSSEITNDLHEQVVAEFIRDTASSVLNEELNKKR